MRPTLISENDLAALFEKRNKLYRFSLCCYASFYLNANKILKGENINIRIKAHRMFMHGVGKTLFVSD